MKVLLGMSGGVDSTVAAVKLLEHGFEVEGAVLKMHEYTETDAARSAAHSVGIPIHEIDCTFEFDRIVKDNFINEYSRGRTPNPCIICNEQIKFKMLAEYASKNGFDKIATGHYARIVSMTGEDGKAHSAVAMGDDKRKDQSYMLWRLDEWILDMLVLPLAEENKGNIINEAKEKGLSAAERDESQEICFIPDGDYASFIENVLGRSRHGDFVDSAGRVLGEHKGIIRYTVGQRKGLGIATGERMFVNEIDPATNSILLAPTPKESKTVVVDSVKLSPVINRAHATFECKVKVRYLAPLCDAKVTLISSDMARVELGAPARSVTPGQSLVMYIDGAVIGGGSIRQAE